MLHLINPMQKLKSSTTTIDTNKLETKSTIETIEMNEDTKALPIIPKSETLPDLNKSIKTFKHDDELFDIVRCSQRIGSRTNCSYEDRPIHEYNGILHCHCCEVKTSVVRMWKGNQQPKDKPSTDYHYGPLADQLHVSSGTSSTRHDFTLYDRFLHQSHAPRKTYIPTKNLFRSPMHWGQRKLLMSEIEFLTLYAPTSDHYGSGKKITVVYAGAAPGKHISLLSEMFPHVNFILIDPNTFDKGLSETPFLRERIQIRQEYFTDLLVNEFSSNNPANKDTVFLFLSDIRSADPKKQGAEEHENYVQSDMLRQMNWISTMKPRFSMIKFRLPYEKGETLYLDGLIFLPVWGRQATTETRLLIDSENMKLRWYDNQQYEEQMFYFNRVTRPSLFPHDCKLDEMDYCYDCRSEIFILEMYVNTFKDLEHRPYTIPMLFDMIRRNLGSRSLLLLIHSENMKFSEIEHLTPKQQADRAKQEERKYKLEDERKRKNYYRDGNQPPKRNCYRY